MARKKKDAEPEMEQEFLDPDFKPVKNARVHKAAKRYYDCIRERKAVGEDEVAAHDTLLNTMSEEGLEHYEYQGLVVNVDTSKKCKVKMASTDSGSDDE